MNDDSGFTLVEMSIVMIIIALLIGAILKGQELINNTRITATVSQLKAIEASINTFRDSYQGLPGDIVNPTSRLPNCLATTKCGIGGDGNFKIGLTPGYTETSQSENIAAWAQLAVTDVISGVANSESNANIIAGKTVPDPGVPGQIYIGYSAGGILRNSTTLSDQRAGHYLLIYSGVDSSSTGAPNTAVAATPTANVPAPLAGRIDKKIDDGFPNTGNIIGMGLVSANVRNRACTNASSSTGLYTDTGRCGIYYYIKQ